jgi:hypothetical protein
MRAVFSPFIWVGDRGEQLRAALSCIPSPGVSKPRYGTGGLRPFQGWTKGTDCSNGVFKKEPYCSICLLVGWAIILPLFTFAFAGVSAPSGVSGSALCEQALMVPMAANETMAKEIRSHRCFNPPMCFAKKPSNNRHQWPPMGPRVPLTVGVCL